jgi:hypothetical protein
MSKALLHAVFVTIFLSFISMWPNSLLTYICSHFGHWYSAFFSIFLLSYTEVIYILHFTYIIFNMSNSQRHTIKWYTFETPFLYIVKNNSTCNKDNQNGYLVYHIL